ncbi:major capsid protein [Lentilactobacillus sp. SPB1-3]|uniref:Major capsid protein n=1 Tax=Lentilactobacillus terminaliae TaxID=3003483 RepID=A0ACD5DD79_9LACO|nr:major capsid protein [Lentilactobacillus sp. SPB1-3]MCZ0978036.1 major capsid protein [Lentilactobacillus sp. SPB1-3]
MLTMSDIENPASIIGYWNERDNERQPYLYSSLFDLSYSPTDTTKLYFGEESKLRMMTATTDDVSSVKLDNHGFESETYSLIPFKNYKAMNEKRRRGINRALANNNDPAGVTAITRTQYKELDELMTVSYGTREIMAMQALTTGKIAVVGSDGSGSNNLPYQVDFHMPEEHQVDVATEWGTPDSKPLEDIQKQMDQIADDNGTSIGVVLMNGRTFRKLAASGEVVTTLTDGRTSAGVALAQSAVTALVQETLGVQVVIYNKGIGSDRFIPDDTVVLAPQGPLGRMVWTDTNEDLGLIGEPSVQLSRTTDGITVYTDRIKDPVATLVHVSQNILPTFDKVRNVLVMHVGAKTTQPSGQTASSTTSDSSVKK